MTSDTDTAAIPDPAEATDGSVLGEDAGDDTLPGTIDFPPTRPVGVGPADSISDADHHDSVAERAAREETESAMSPDAPIRVVDPYAGGALDTEAESVGEAVDAVGLVSPEEAALHIEETD